MVCLKAWSKHPEGLVRGAPDGRSGAMKMTLLFVCKESWWLGTLRRTENTLKSYVCTYILHLHERHCCNGVLAKEALGSGSKRPGMRPVRGLEGRGFEPRGRHILPCFRPCRKPEFLPKYMYHQIDQIDS